MTVSVDFDLDVEVRQAYERLGDPDPVLIAKAVLAQIPETAVLHVLESVMPELVRFRLSRMRITAARQVRVREPKSGSPVRSKKWDRVRTALASPVCVGGDWMILGDLTQAACDVLVGEFHARSADMTAKAEMYGAFATELKTRGRRTVADLPLKVVEGVMSK